MKEREQPLSSWTEQGYDDTYASPGYNLSSSPQSNGLTHVLELLFYILICAAASH